MRPIRVWRSLTYNLGEHYSHHGHTALALTLFDKARALSPDTAVFHYNWATVCSLFRVDAQRVYGWDNDEIFRRSLSGFRQARDLAPQNYTYADAYASTFMVMAHPDWEAARQAWLYCLKFPMSEVEREFIYGRISRVCLHQEHYTEAQHWIDQMTAPQVASMREALRRKLVALPTPTTPPPPVVTISSVAATATPR